MPTPRLRLLLLVCFASSCTPKVEVTSIEVTVEHPASLSSTCVLVVASGGGVVRPSDPLAVSGEATLTTTLQRGELPPAVSLQAIGYTDPGCTQPSVPAEASAVVAGLFAAPPSQVTLRLLKAESVDRDGDGVSPPTDCDDTDPDIKPGATERCNDSLDNDCNGAIDCNDTACELLACGNGAVCMGRRCVETVCGDGIDGDRDGNPDCGDADCLGRGCGPGSNTNAVCVGIRCQEQACSNGADDDRDGLVDCVDPDCAGAACGTGGTCVATGPDGGAAPRCQEANETLCDDGMDNDADGLTDCVDPDCLTRACDDGAACTTGERCAAGACSGGQARLCNQPPSSCVSAAGLCEAATGVCRYGAVPATTACDDVDACTTPDRCDGDGGCAGTPKTCAAPPGACFAGGVCQRALDGGCTFAVTAGASCADGDNCTVGDSCGSDGGCAAGPRTPCPAPQCQLFLGSCSAAGACQFSPAPPASVCDAGTCNGSGLCVPTGVDAGSGDAGTDAGQPDAGPPDAGQTDAGVFPFTPDNLVASQHPPQGPLTIDCALTFNSDPGGGFGTCPGFTPPATTVADGGAAGELAVISVASLFITDAGSLVLSGSRPVVVLVWGDAVVNGPVLANSTRPGGTRVGPGAAPGLTCSARAGGAGGVSNNRGGGGGGAGYFSAGAAGGGANSTAVSGGAAGASATGGDAPLFVGCPGGTGNADNVGGLTPGGLGGGTVQLTVAGTATFNAIITASGQGGQRATGGSDPGGGGGGSGGTVSIHARRLVLTGAARLTANGGAGGGGAQGGTAGDGADGATATAAPAGGGVNESGGGAGGAGGAGASVPGAGTTAGRGGGGGGGAAGRVFLKHVDTGVACQVDPSAVLSPAAVRTNCP